MEPETFTLSNGEWMIFTRDSAKEPQLKSLTAWRGGEYAQKNLISLSWPGLVPSTHDFHPVIEPPIPPGAIFLHGFTRIVGDILTRPRLSVGEKTAIGINTYGFSETEAREVDFRKVFKPDKFEDQVGFYLAELAAKQALSLFRFEDVKTQSSVWGRFGVRSLDDVIGHGLLHGNLGVSWPLSSLLVPGDIDVLSQFLARSSLFELSLDQCREMLRAVAEHYRPRSEPMAAVMRR